ncbi:hypothetical protein INR49_010052 [Caranx melampygus]|nr:hypothetical protein INR49_010052 [Caranx melampygus]
MSDGDDEVTSSSHRDTVCPQRCRIPREVEKRLINLQFDQKLVVALWILGSKGGSGDKCVYGRALKTQRLRRRRRNSGRGAVGSIPGDE